MPEQDGGQNVQIDRLGAGGDGIAMAGGKPIYVPGALPGETVRVEGDKARKRLVEILQASGERVEPFCRNFGTCGGCQVQHLTQDTYAVWKTGQLHEAFSREGINIHPEPMLTFDRANRRRAVLTAKRSGDAFSLGFSERGSNRLADIETCPILVSEINAVLPAVRDLLTVFADTKGDLRIHLLAADNGIDIAFGFSGKSPPGMVRSLTTHKAAGAFARISVNGETVLERTRPLLNVGTARVSPPPGAFVQASATAEKAMAGLVCDHLKSCKRVADLFSGFGTFALKLAVSSIVHAAESDADALSGLDRAWRETGGALKTVSHEKRDLFRRPMMAKELKAFDGVAFDPPRAGAEAQCRELAKSGVRKIAAVSCNPVTLARDVSLLLEGGFKIVSITPIDQFAHTPHLETVVLLEK